MEEYVQEIADLLAAQGVAAKEEILNILDAWAIVDDMDESEELAGILDAIRESSDLAALQDRAAQAIGSGAPPVGPPAPVLSEAEGMAASRPSARRSPWSGHNLLSDKLLRGRRFRK